ncbi:MAG TPA: hypothetical protein DCQ64_07055, partial [Candidatus Rokubacteria bacterium]|nr:hypothetical protein [Candidatus Rokubacteria bacterium]
GLALVDGAIVGPADAKTTEIPWEWYSWEREDGQWSRVEILPAGYVVQARIQLGLLRMACAVQGLPLPTQAVYVGLDLTGAPMVPDGDGVRLDLDRAPLMVRWVDHNEDLFRDQYWYAVRWWDRYILGDEEPPDDDSDCCQRWRLYEQAHGYGERPATPEESALIAEWLALKEANKTNEAERKTLQARILAGMDTPRLTLAGKQRVQLQLTGRNMTLRDYGF